MADSQDNNGDTDSVLVRDSTEFFSKVFDEDGSLVFSDSKVSCGGEEFEVQRVILAAFSPVLKRLFIQNQQNNPGKPLELSKEYVTKESFSLIMDLIYKGQITIDGDNVLRLHSAGNYLEIEQVVNKCSDFIIKRLNVDSVVSVWDYACKQTATANRLLSGTLRFMGANFSKLVKHDTVLALQKVEFCLLLGQLTTVDDENLVLEAALEWLGHNWKARFKDCEEVLSCVLWQFVDRTRCCELKSLEAIQLKIDPKSNEELLSMNTLFSKVCGTGAKNVSPDNPTSNIFYMIIEKEGYCTFQKLSLAQQELTGAPTVSKIEQQIQPVKSYVFSGFFTFQGRLLAVLSHEGDGNFKQGFMLAGVSENGDSKILAQFEVFAMNQTCNYVKITSHGGVLTIFLHKFGEDPFLLSTYDLRKFGRRFVYDDDELFIIPVQSRTVDIQPTGSIVSNSTLQFPTEVYFFGVSKTDSITDCVDVDVFHLANQEWSKLPCLQAARRCASAEVIDRSFFVVGGITGSSSVSNAVEMMSIDDPSAWEQLPGLKYGRCACSLISCGHFLMAFGGKDRGNAAVEKAEILDLQNLAKGWEEYPPLHGVNPKFVVKT